MHSTTTQPIVARLWRDHDGEAMTLPGMDLGVELIHTNGSTMDVVGELFARGVRRLRLDAPVNLADSGQTLVDLRTLALVRDLTAFAIVVDWRLRLAPDRVEQWELLGHLWPPGDIAGPTDGNDVLRRWRQQHYIGKCAHRRGPGFVQVRDRRWGNLRRLTLDEPAYVAAVPTFASGAEPAVADKAIVDDLTAARLLLPVGDLMLWLPYQASRWFHSTMFM
jgi:hypothetical protein